MRSLILGMDLQPAVLQHISFLIHIFLAFQSAHDLTKDKFHDTRKKRADSILLTFVTCLWLSQSCSYWLLPANAQQLNIGINEGKEENRT